MESTRPLRTALVCLAALLSAAPAFALYKVIGPDGKVSFTDKPPAAADTKVQQINPGRGGAVPADAALPIELRQAVQRYPVTLYVTTDCPACDNARRLLSQRGVPFSEKTVTTQADLDALKGVSGGHELPVISIGTKTLRGLQSEELTSYLDLAGYPKDSKLPRGYRPSAPTPLVPAAPAAEAPTSPPAGGLPVAPEPARPGPGGFRF